jgi:hypothetical protein
MTVYLRVMHLGPVSLQGKLNSKEFSSSQSSPILCSQSRYEAEIVVYKLKYLNTLSKSEALPSARLFVEYFLSGTRQRDTRQSPALGNELVYRVQNSRHRNTLGKDIFAECQTLGEGGSRQRVVSVCLWLTDVSFFAECQPADTRQNLLYRVPS